MKIVDTLAEQSLLETVLERTKPPVPSECRDLHYLLATPFRDGAPYPSGSRFRRAGFTPGVFYGSSTPATAVAEVAFHRLLFFADSPETPWPGIAGEHTVFSVRFRTAAGLDLTRPPFERGSESMDEPRGLDGLPGSCRSRARGRCQRAEVCVCPGSSWREPRAADVWCLRVASASGTADVAHPSWLAWCPRTL